MLRFRVFRSIHVVLIVFGFILILSGPIQQRASAADSDHAQIQRLQKVMEIIKKNYLREVHDEELLDGAIRGMLQSLDPNCSYFNAEALKVLQSENKGRFGGIGVEITLKDGALTVVSPLGGCPADKAGVESGDRIVSINGETTQNITLPNAVKSMRGTIGSIVTLTIMREGFQKPRDFVITRDEIHVSPLKKVLLEEGYPYIKLVSFQEGTDEELSKAFKDFRKKHPIRGLILDLRDNPGGLLDQAVKVANLFITKGLICYTNGRLKEQRMEFRAQKGGEHYEFKMAVLINKGSAGASEIVTAALQDHNRGLVFGIHSFGRAAIQTIHLIGDGSALRLTTAHYYTPNGKDIDKEGILPDVDLEKEIVARTSVTAGGKKAAANIRENPGNDIAIRKALQWLKSETSVIAYKAANRSPEASAQSQSQPIVSAEAQKREITRKGRPKYQELEASKDYKEARKRYRVAAERGDLESQVSLGYVYEKALGVPKDYQKAAKWYRMAAEKGNANGQALLGLMYKRGLGVAKDLEEARQWFKKSAEQENPLGQNELANLYSEGVGVGEDYAEALRLYRRSAEQNYPAAQYNIGRMYQYGKGVPKDEKEAAQWYLKAAEQGHSLAEDGLGRMYRDGVGIPKDEKEALKWFRKAAEAGSKYGELDLGLMYAQGLGGPRNYEEALTWFRRAAGEGLDEARYRIGLMYLDGLGTEKDMVEAAIWFSKAGANGFDKSKEKIKELMDRFRPRAEKKDAEAQYNLGVLYEAQGNIEKHTGHVADAVKSYAYNHKCYILAARQGYAPAQYRLALIAANTGSPDEALSWCRKAADKGYFRAQAYIGDLYLIGKGGLKQSPEEAAKWFRKAADQGFAYTQNNLGFLYLKGRGVRQKHRRSDKMV